MTCHTFDPAHELLLASWEFDHQDAAGNRTVATRTVSVPHSAFDEIPDIRAGGTVTYRTEIVVATVSGTEELFFEGVGPDAEICVNGETSVGSPGTWSEFSVPLAGLLRDGANEIEVKVSLPDYSPNSPLHFRNVLQGFTPDVAGPFAGIWRPVSMRMGDAVRGLRVRVMGPERAVEVVWDADERDPDDHVFVELSSGSQESGQVWSGSSPASSGRCIVHCEAARPWTPDEPVLHRMRVFVVGSEGDPSEIRDEAVGFRELKAVDDRIEFSGQPFHMRGILHWGHNPATGLPSMSEDEARSELELLKSMGFNTVKLCLFVPQRHYLKIADEMGMVIWQEFPLWLPRDMYQVQERVAREYPGLARFLSQHPSVAIVSLGCELEAHVSDEFLGRTYEAVRTTLPDALIVANSGSDVFGAGSSAPTDAYDYHFYGDVHHLSELIPPFVHAPKPRKPWLFGEFNDFDTWRTLPRQDEDPEPWLSKDFAVNALRSVHAGFASDQQTYRQHEIVADEGYLDELDGLEELSLDQGLASRRLVFDHVRGLTGVTGYVLTVLRDAPVTSAGLLHRDGRPKWGVNEIASLNAPIHLSVHSPLARRWTDGGDRLRIMDPYNIRIGAPHRLIVACDNATETSGPALLRISVVQSAITLFETTQVVMLEPHATTWLPELTVAPICSTITTSQEATLRVALESNREHLAVADWPILLHPPTPDVSHVIVFDPRGVLDATTREWGLTPLRTLDELRAELKERGSVITTELSAATREFLSERMAQVFACATVSDLFGMTRGPFWRENVARVHDGSFLRDALPHEHLGTASMALATDWFVGRRDLRSLTGYQPLLSRYDARTYVAAEYVFSWNAGGADFVFSTLSHAGGLGCQPHHADDNVLGQRILEAWITDRGRSEQSASLPDRTRRPAELWAVPHPKTGSPQDAGAPRKEEQ